MLNYERSLLLGEAIKAQNIRCFWNARNAIVALKDGAYSDENPPISHYVEGYAVRAGTDNIIYHGWLETENGEIVDPTMWAYAEKFGEDESRYYSYHPATRRRIDELYSITNELPLLKEGDDCRLAAEEEANESAQEQNDIQPLVGYCYAMASLRLRSLYQAGHIGVRYVEGCVSNIQADGSYDALAKQHAWLESAIGEIIDPTLDEEDEETRYVYYAAYRFTVSEFEEALGENGLPLRPYGRELVEAQHRAFDRKPGQLRRLSSV